MKSLRISGRFHLDLDATRERLGRDYEPETLFYCAELLVQGNALPDAMGDHPLVDGLAGYRDFHLDPDWVVIYRVTDTEVVLHRTGRHIDVFAKRLPKKRR